MTATADLHPSPAHPPARAVVPVLAIGAMLGIMNVGSFGPLIPDISRDLSTSAPVLGQITALIFLFATGIGLVVGPLGDKYGNKRLVVLGLGVISLSALGTMLAPTYGWLLAARLISALSTGIIGGMTLAIAANLFVGDQRRRAMGTIASGIALGPIVAVPALTFIAASLSSWRVSYAALSLFAFGWMLLASRVLSEDRIRDAGRVELRTFLSAYQPLIHQHHMMMLYSATLTRALAWFGTLVYIGAYLDKEHGFATHEIGWTMMLAGIGYFVGTKIAGNWSSAIDLRTLYSTSTVASALFFGAAMILPVGALAAIPMLILGAVGGGIAFVTLITLVSSESTAGQGTTMSLNTAMFTLGSALGASAGGFLLALGGFIAFGVGLTGFALISAVLVVTPTRLRTPTPGRSAAAD